MSLNHTTDTTAVELVSLRQVAEALGMDRSAARKYLIREGFKPTKRRTPDSNGAIALTLTREEADRLIALRKDQGFFPGTFGKATSDETGIFYVIQLIPELDPNRIKLGFASSIEERLAQHRTSAPTAIVRMTWPCRKTWEPTAIAALTAVNCRLILNEVYECENIEDLEIRGEGFFSFLPSPRFMIPLASSSPLHPDA